MEHRYDYGAENWTCMDLFDSPLDNIVSGVEREVLQTDQIYFEGTGKSKDGITYTFKGTMKRI